MISLPPGTLVRPRALVGNVDGTTFVVNKHGPLWLVSEHHIIPNRDNQPTWVWCKSLATGFIYDFHVDELTIEEEE